MICPHCNTRHRDKYGTEAENDTLHEGSNTFYYRCPHCKEKYSVHFYLVVKHEPPVKADHNQSLSFEFDE